MAALASSRQHPPAVQQLTPPSSSHGGGASWDFAVPLDNSVRIAPNFQPPDVIMSHVARQGSAPALLQLSITPRYSALTIPHAYTTTMVAANPEYIG
jgi:hypothetical protein